MLKLDAQNVVAVAREVEILKQARHPNIVGYYDYFTRLHDGEELLWIILEYCALGSALDVMERQGAPLSEAEAALVLREVLTALRYLHVELRALHRDVKAANVLLTASGAVKLGDLGVAAQVCSALQAGDAKGSYSTVLDRISRFPRYPPQPAYSRGALSTLHSTASPP
mmetsp:Transcript_15307/g.45480  ORF Transcript_15307/g.45480 Transcript_15307/m.45480 type:complete len:169 (+) Transcript_15307:362-868(+)